MIKPNEEERVGALHAYNIFETEPEAEFDELAQLAASICDAPVSKINLLDDKKQWAKSLHGVGEDERTIPRELSVCQYAIKQSTIFEIPDLSRDERFQNLPFVKNEPHFKYYLGAQLVTPRGYTIGALCILDYEARQLPERKKKQVKFIANQVMARLELRKQNIELAELNKHHVNLMKILSHDLRSPLSGIIGMSDLLDKLISPDNADAKEMVSILNQSAKQLNQLINDILNYTIIESKGFSLNLAKTDVHSIVDNLKKLYIPSAKLKNIDLTFEVDDFEEEIWIDEEKFEQIYGNLLSNAIKFTESNGKIKSSVTVKEVDGVRHLVLKVSDNGMGMENEMVQNLFSQNIPKNNKKGTSGEKSSGLGISIIKHFTELHNGQIDVESTSGEGTTFTIYLPLDRDKSAG